jgi:hypothetical protein
MALLVAGGLAPITIPSNWGITGPSASPVTSVTKTLTVPAGNSGDLLFHLTTAPTGTIGYSKNAAAFVNFTVDTTVNFANTNTLAFKLTGGGDNAALTVTDVTTGGQVGTCSLLST